MLPPHKLKLTITVIGGPHSKSGRFGGEINALSWPGFRTQDHPVHSLATILTTLRELQNKNVYALFN